MSGFKTAAFKTLVALVTAGIASVLASTLTASPATAASAPSGSATFAESTAQQTYAALRTAFDADTKAAATTAKATAKKAIKKAAKKAKKSGKRLTAAARRKITQRTVARAVAAVAPLNDAARIAALPATLSAPIIDADLTLPEGLLTFHTGVEDTAACLDLSTGATTPGRCYGSHEPLPQNLTYTYDSLVRTVQWFDAHADVYGETAHSVALLDRVTTTEVPAAANVEFVDADADSLVDGGEVTLTVDGMCGTVVLPEHDPTGTTYKARLLHGTC